ncbi:MAG TPA: proton-translocating transhydrogenase family protein [Caulifigura sp.]|jgi:hypothetical protein|nr:proton-translocating transhydrogenase family protein [Caulifigura sp.]
MNGAIPILAGASGYADPAVASVTIFLLTAVIGWKLFSDLATANPDLRLAVPVALSGAVLVGAIIVTASSTGWFGRVLGILACALAGGAAVGGFLVARSLLEGPATTVPTTEAAQDADDEVTA